MRWMKKSWNELEYVPSKSKPHSPPASVRQVIPGPPDKGLALLFVPVQVCVPPDAVVTSLGPV